MAEFIVKVNPKHTVPPATHVRTLLRALDVDAEKPPAVEEVFPGLRSGHGAGLVTVDVPDVWSPEARQTLVDTLRRDAAVEYVQEPKRRRPSR